MEHPLILISIGELVTFIVEPGNSSGVCIKVTSSVAAVASASKTSIGTKSNVSVSLLLIADYPEIIFVSRCSFQNIFTPRAKSTSN